MPIKPLNNTSVTRDPVSMGHSSRTSNTSGVRAQTTSATSSTAQSSGMSEAPIDPLDSPKPSSQQAPSKGVSGSQSDIAEMNERRSASFNSRADGEVAKLALVGHGSSIVYQLSSMGDVDHSKTTLVGRVDANQKVFNQAKASGAKMVDDEVTSVKKREDGLIALTTKKGPPLLAEKASLGTGTGPHSAFGTRGPKPAEGLPGQQIQALEGKVVGLDDDMRQFPLTDAMKASLSHGEPPTGKTVIVHGANAR